MVGFLFIFLFISVVALLRSSARLKWGQTLMMNTWLKWPCAAVGNRSSQNTFPFLSQLKWNKSLSTFQRLNFSEHIITLYSVSWQTGQLRVAIMKFELSFSQWETGLWGLSNPPSFWKRSDGNLVDQEYLCVQSPNTCLTPHDSFKLPCCNDCKFTDGYFSSSTH